MTLENKWHQTVVSLVERGKACLSQNPAESIKLLRSAIRYAKETKQNLPEEYQDLYRTAVEGGINQSLEDAKKGILNDKPGEVSRYLNSALGLATEIEFKLPKNDLEYIVGYLGKMNMDPNFSKNLKKYITDLGLEGYYED